MLYFIFVVKRDDIVLIFINNYNDIVKCKSVLGKTLMYWQILTCNIVITCNIVYLTI